jgi:hypothetical protein
MSKYLAPEDFALIDATSGAPFGTDRRRIGASLRRMADLIESNKIHVQKVELISVTQAGELASNSLAIKFMETYVPETEL